MHIYGGETCESHLGFKLLYLMLASFFELLKNMSIVEQSKIKICQLRIIYLGRCLDYLFYL